MAKRHAKHEHSFPSCVFWLWQILPKASSSKSDEIQNPPVGPHYPRTASLPAISAIPGKWRASGWRNLSSAKHGRENDWISSGIFPYCWPLWDCAGEYPEHGSCYQETNAGVSQENGYNLRTQLIFLPRKEKRSSCQTATFPLLLFCFKYKVYHALQYILLIHAILLIIWGFVLFNPGYMMIPSSSAKEERKDYSPLCFSILWISL